MKKVLLAASIASALSLFNVAQAANTGTITFEGKIIDQTCDASVDGKGASATVKLGGAPMSSLNANGKTAGYTPFTISLTNCKAQAANWGVTAYFPDNATNIDSSKQILKNQATDTPASNVGLELLQNVNGTKTVVPLGKAVTDTNYKFFTQDKAATSATLTYGVQYKATGVSTAGNVKGLAVYELSYN